MLDRFRKLNPGGKYNASESGEPTTESDENLVEITDFIKKIAKEEAKGFYMVGEAVLDDKGEPTGVGLTIKTSSMSRRLILNSVHSALDVTPQRLMLLALHNLSDEAECTCGKCDKDDGIKIEDIIE